MSLEMRSICERCGVALAADGPAFICSYECTFCANCGGELVAQPRRRPEGTSQA